MGRFSARRGGRRGLRRCGLDGRGPGVCRPHGARRLGGNGDAEPRRRRFGEPVDADHPVRDERPAHRRRLTGDPELHTLRPARRHRNPAERQVAHPCRGHHVGPEPVGRSRRREHEHDVVGDDRHLEHPTDHQRDDPHDARRGQPQHLGGGRRHRGGQGRKSGDARALVHQHRPARLPDSREAANKPQLVVTTATTSTTSSSTTSSTTTSSTATTSTTTPPSSVTLVPTVDTYVEDGTPTTNYGTSTQLTVDRVARRELYLRFDLTSLTGSVQSASCVSTWRTSATAGARPAATSRA